jgi:hypothetical protein
MGYTASMHYLAAVRRFGTFTARLGTVAGIIAVANWLFDYLVTGWAIWHFGAFVGGAIIITMALALNYCIVFWYRRTTKDWFGMEWLRAQEAVQSVTWSGRIIRSLLRKSRLLAFAAIAALVDPIYAFIYQRGRITGAQFTPGDWWWFGTANVIGILPWILGASVIIEAAKLTVN